jgi:hypothetical protein
MAVTDESRSADSALLTALRAALARVVSAIRAFGATLPDQTGKPRTEVPWFGDYEKVEEAKYYPPVPPSLADDGDLLDWSARPGVTLLAVDPYLLYVYWDFDLANLPPDTTAAVLRFYDGAIHFDVDVDLRTRNWYVPLWNPAKTYYADLGAIATTGKFIPLLRSNTIQTSRAWPAAEVEHRFISGAGASRHSELPVPPQPVPYPLERGGILETAHSPEGSPTAAEPLAGEAEPTVYFSPATGHRPPASIATEPTERHVPKPPGAAEILRRKLAEFHEFRQREPQAQGAAAESPHAIAGFSAASYPPDGQPKALGAAVESQVTPGLPDDLTAHLEREFLPGLSSLLLGARGPRKPAG